MKIKKALEKAIENGYYNDNDFEIENLVNNIDYNFILYPREINNKALFESIKFVLDKAKLVKEDIDDFILIGGHFEFIEILLSKQYCFIDISPREINAYGATIQALYINEQYNFNLVEISSISTKNDSPMNEIVNYFLNKINKDMIDLKNEIIEYKYLESNEGKILLSELNERIENENKDLESIKICDELIEKVKKWIKEMKTMELEKKISILEIELKQNKNDKKIAMNERNEIEKNYKILVEKYKKLQKTNK